MLRNPLWRTFGSSLATLSGTWTEVCVWKYCAVVKLATCSYTYVFTQSQHTGSLGLPLNVKNIIYMQPSYNLLGRTGNAGWLLILSQLSFVIDGICEKGFVQTCHLQYGYVSNVCISGVCRSSWTCQAKCNWRLMTALYHTSSHSKWALLSNSITYHLYCKSVYSSFKWQECQW